MRAPWEDQKLPPPKKSETKIERTVYLAMSDEIPLRTVTAD